MWWGFFLLFLSVCVEGSKTVLSRDSICRHCQCYNQKTVCDFAEDTDRHIVIEDVDENTQILKVSNCSSLTFRRGAFTIKTSFYLSVQSIQSVEVESKAFHIKTSDEVVKVDFSSVEQLVINSRAFSAQTGHLDLKADQCRNIEIQSQSFDILTSIQIKDCGVLQLSPSSLKPNVLSYQPTMEMLLYRVHSIPFLPKNTFSSAMNISIMDSSIGDIEEGSFSGISVGSITLRNASVGRIHYNAFPDKSLVAHLTFKSCLLSSIAEDAIRSAISTLSIETSEFESISHSAINSHVAKISIQNNTFQTLSRKSFIFHSWTELAFSQNLIRSMEEGALLGIAQPQQENENVTFAFTENAILNVNKGAFQSNLSAESILIDVQNNAFKNELCRCDFDSWLDIVCSSEPNKFDFAPDLKNSSFCQLSAEESQCFMGSEVVQFSQYQRIICSLDRQDLACLQPKSPWQLFQDELEIHTNKGIFLLILIFVMISSLIVGILTLFRWIIYTITMRSKTDHLDEWNFTKIEERQVLHLPSPIEHYESLPMKERESNEETRTEMSDTENAEDVAKPEEVAKSPSPEPEPTVGEPPKQTFYDEMLCLLKEKLEDPENYATVFDTRNGQIYDEPFAKNKENHGDAV